MLIVVKIGTSSLTDPSGRISHEAIAKLSAEVATLRANGNDVLIVTSAAITAGLLPLGFDNDTRPKDMQTLQAAAAVGQSRLLRAYDEALGAHDLVGGQVLVSPSNFFDRSQYLHVRDTLLRLLQLGVIPIINENDVVADDEIRFGDNDRIAALVAHSVGADVLVLLTDMAGLFTADPRHDENALLIADVAEVDNELLSAVGGTGTAGGSGGMASKLSAARIASWSGVRTVIAAASRPSVVVEAVAGEPDVGTVVHPRAVGLSARKLWIAFAVPPAGQVTIDGGAVEALVEGNRSLLAAGVSAVVGSFGRESCVDIVDGSGEILGRGRCRYSADQLRENLGRRIADLSPDVSPEVVHRDDLVVFRTF